MDRGASLDGMEPKSPEEEEDSFDWLLGRDSPEIAHAPMDTNLG